MDTLTRRSTRGRRRLGALLAAAVFVATTAGTASAVGALGRRHRAEEREALDDATAEVARSLGEHLRVYQERLLAIRGLYATSEAVSRQQYTEFVLALTPQAGLAPAAPSAVLPVAQPPIFFVRRLAPADVRAYRSELHADGVDGPGVLPSTGEEQFVLDRSAPLPLRPEVQSADVAVDEQRRRALEAARDSGLMAITGPITLLTDSALRREERPLAFAMYVPVYRGAAVPATVAARREQLIGWAGSALRAQDWLAAVLPALPSDLVIELRDDTGPGGGGLAVHPASTTPEDLEGSASVASRALELGGRRFTVSVHALAPPTGALGQQAALAGAGLLVAVLLAALVWVQSRSKANAYDLVDQTTAALREREGRLRLLAENATDLVALQDPQGRVRYASTSWRTQLGWDPESLVGRDLAELVHPEDRGRVRGEVAAGRLVGAATTEFVARLRGADGDFRWFEARGRFVRDGDGGLVEVQLALRDVTSRQRAETELLDSLDRERQMVHRLRAANEENAHVVSDVSHELRTPLTNVLGYIELLAEGDAGPLTGDQARMVEVVDRNTRRLLELIEDLLTISRMESDHLDLLEFPVEVDDVITAACRSVGSALRGRDLQLECDAPHGLVVPGDAEQLERAVANLVTNAVKFTPDGGRILVAAHSEGDDVVVSVRDDGPGIPLEDQAHLFDRFFRSSTARDLAVQGTGLGLPIAKGIVEHHGGTISLRSAPGEGTEVTLRLPRDPAAAAVAR